MQYDFLIALEIIFIASAAVVFFLHKLNMPSLVGFLVAGIIIGPHGIGFIRDTHVVELLAEIGVVLLLFTIGIEFSLAKLTRMKKAVLAGGGMQVLLTILFSAVAANLAAGGIKRSIFLGFLIALSSTTVVLKLLAENGEIDSPHGRIMVGILIFQDLCVVPLMLLTPALSGAELNFFTIATDMGKAILIIAAVLFGARWIVPRMLHEVVGTRSRELFIITILMLCLGIALLTFRFGLSLALGAFLAGLVISESEYAHQATADILPFKESFIGLFFVSVGMLMDVTYMTDHCLVIAIVVAAIFGLKMFTGILSALAAGNPLRSSLHAGLGLAQIGEFSFVLAVAGKTAGIITESFYQLFLSSSVVTMTITPFMLKAAPSVAGWVVSRELLKRALRLKKFSEVQGAPRKKQDHVIIIGFGLNGRNVARVLKDAAIPYLVLEVNSDTVREMKKKGEPIYYGDATSLELLRKLSIERAKLLVVAISDPSSTRKIVSISRHESPAIYIIVRTRYVAEVEDLKALGANEVIPEEFETSIEIFTRVLHQYRFPPSVVADMVETIRSDSYTALRSIELPKRHLFEKCEWLPEVELDGFRIPEASFMIGLNIGELRVRKKTGVTIIAVRRGAQIIANPAPDFVFLQGDIILFTGDRKSMDAALLYFKEGS